jgi:Glycosyl hydrolase family 65 central catalytic domain
LTGQLEEHITADVAWAAAHYASWTGLGTPAVAPLLAETARYWASRCRLDVADHAHIDGVIGPDEYHERIDDNAFTNVMARWNLRPLVEFGCPGRALRGTARPPARPASCYYRSFGRILCLPGQLRVGQPPQCGPAGRPGKEEVPEGARGRDQSPWCHGPPRPKLGHGGEGGIPMGIAQRIAELYAAKMNAVLDRAADPRELADYSYVQLQDLLTEVHRGAAQVAVGRERAERRVSELQHAAGRPDSRLGDRTARARRRRGHVPRPGPGGPGRDHRRHAQGSVTA